MKAQQQIEKLRTLQESFDNMSETLIEIADMYSNIALNSAILITPEEFNAALNDLISQLI